MRYQKNRILISTFIISLIINSIYGYKIISYRIKSNNKDVNFSYVNNRDKLYEKLQIDSTDIVFFGNSQTQNFAVNELIKNNNIKNRGISGDMASHAKSRISNVALAKPRKIFIELGINDLRNGDDNNTVVSNLSDIVDSVNIYSRETKLYIISIFPINETREVTKKVTNKEIAITNSKIKEMCFRKGVTYIDLHSRMTKNGSLNEIYDCGDGLHLTAEGYFLWRDSIEGLI